MLKGAFQRRHGGGHVVSGDFRCAFVVGGDPVQRSEQVFIQRGEKIGLLFGDRFRHHQSRLGDAVLRAEGFIPDFVDGEAAHHVHAFLFAFEDGGAGERFGQQGVREVFLQKEGDGFRRGGGVGDKIGEVDARPLGEDLQDEIGHIALERHDQFLPGKIFEAGDGFALAHYGEQATRHDVVQDDGLALCAQVSGDVAGHNADFDAFVQKARAQLVGAGPAFYGEGTDFARFAHLCCDGKQYGRRDRRSPQGKGAIGSTQRQGGSGKGGGGRADELTTF